MIWEQIPFPEQLLPWHFEIWQLSPSKPLKQWHIPLTVLQFPLFEQLLPPQIKVSQFFPVYPALQMHCPIFFNLFIS